MSKKNASERKSLKLKGNAAEAKNRQQLPTFTSEGRKEERRRKGGKSSFDRIGLEKVAVKLSVQEMRQSFCVSEALPLGYNCCLRFLLQEKKMLPALL